MYWVRGLIHECQVLERVEEGIFCCAGLPCTQRAVVGAAVVRLHYCLEPRSRLLRMRGKLVIVDVFQTGHICILDIFISLKMCAYIHQKTVIFLSYNHLKEHLYKVGNDNVIL